MEGEIRKVKKADMTSISSRRAFIRIFGLAGTAFIGNNLLARASASEKSNVLFIAVDDMNDWIGCLKGYPGVKTPNIDYLAKMGVLFENAHCPSPKCCPSRSSIMTGRYPYKTGIYDNSHWWRPNFPDMITIPIYFKQQGYYVAGAGKIFHHTAGNNPPDQWNEYLPLKWEDPWHRGSRTNYPWTEKTPPPKGFPFCGFGPPHHEFDWGPIPGYKEEDYMDHRTVSWCIDFLKKKHKKPFFLACGIFRPHLPWYAPKKYFDLYPLDKIKLPEVLPDDLEDIPEIGRKLAAARRSDFEKIKEYGKWKEAVQAYLASISFADAQIGRLLDGLERSGRMKNTIIVFWSDHGWHLGEKEHFHKSTLWERATRTPFIFAAPGVSRIGSRCRRPVNLVHIFSTLIELCRIPEIKGLDSISLVPLLKDPEAEWDIPSLITYQKGNHCIRGERYRYIRYKDGGEELYDHTKDPNEWHNKAKKPEYEPVKKRLSQWFPKEDAPEVKKKKSFKFDYKKYIWTSKKTGEKIK